MTDVELSSLLSDLRNSANSLNSETSGVNTVIDSVESQIVSMNLGLECWLRGSSVLDSKNPSKDSNVETQLGFANVAGNWSLAIRDVLYEYDKRADEWVNMRENDPTRL